MTKGQRRRFLRAREAREWYKRRGEALLRCGFATYDDYLRSELWATIRKRVLERDAGECKGCGKPASQVHHLSYGDVTLRGDRLDKLVSLCGDCHRFVEFMSPRRKLGKVSVLATAKRLTKRRRLIRRGGRFRLRAASAAG